MKNVTVELAGKTILKNIDLQVYEHETLVIIGPSGSGKTVLLKTLAGVYPPKEGEVLIEGENWQDIDSGHKHDLAQKLGMLFQQSALFDNFTTLENVEFPIREHYHLSDEQVRQKAIHLLESVNLGDALDKYPNELSGGMQRRLGIARALALNPKINFYDDPTAGQDAIQADQVARLIMELKKENDSTLIVVTSNMMMAKRLADRVIMVLGNQIIHAGTPDQLENHPDPRVHQFYHGELNGPIKSY